MGMRAGQLRNPWNQRNEDNIVQMAREEFSRSFMQKRLDSMTACVDTSGPKAAGMRHLELRLKKVQLQEDRRQTIARDNRKLMEKMTDIIKGKGPKNNTLYTPAFQLSGSLNERERRNYVHKVNTDNKMILQRLKAQTAYINVPKMEEDFQRWLENRKVCSKAYKRQKRAKLHARKRQQQHGGSHASFTAPASHDRLLLESPIPGSAQSEPGGTFMPSAAAVPFRTAKQLKDGMLREGKGGFVPLPSLVSAPQPSAYSYCPSSAASGAQDATVSTVGDVPVQFGIQHQGSKTPPKNQQLSSPPPSAPLPPAATDSEESY